MSVNFLFCILFAPPGLNYFQTYLIFARLDAVTLVELGAATAGAYATMFYINIQILILLFRKFVPPRGSLALSCRRGKRSGNPPEKYHGD